MKFKRRRIKNIDELYKGNGITNCKWCANTGLMHTVSNDGYLYADTYCWCKFGDELRHKCQEKDNYDKAAE